MQPTHLAHHFETSRQQFEAAKFGMWMFLATEVLLFGGLFCAYAVFRANHPEIFQYGARFLDTTWGAINTVVLIVSSATMAIAVWCAQCGRQRELVLFLALTLILAVDFLGIKYIEYSHKFHDNLVWGLKFYEEPHPGQTPRPTMTAVATGPAVLKPGDAGRGRGLYLRTCLSCHGPSGEGLPGLGKPLRTSQFVSDRNDADLLEFLRVGRSVGDPLNTTGLIMLPRGGNPALSDQDLVHIIAFLRRVQREAAEASPVTASKPLPEADRLSLERLPRSVIPPPPMGPPGLAGPPSEPGPLDGSKDRVTGADPRHDLERPANAHLFFSIYFAMTGLHALHVLAGMAVITWLLTRAARGHFSRQYFTPVDLGGLFWHIVDLIWIFLFPLLYLIR